MFRGGRESINFSFLNIAILTVSLSDMFAFGIFSSRFTVTAMVYRVLLRFRCGDNGTGIDDLYGATFHGGAEPDDDRESFQFGQHLPRRLVTRAGQHGLG